MLRDHWKRRAQDRLKAGPEWKGTDDYVFRTAWGEPIHPDTVSSLMTTLIKSHNDQHPGSALPHARLHDLRHVHATTLLLAGTQAHVVAARHLRPDHEGRRVAAVSTRVSKKPLPRSEGAADLARSEGLEPPTF